MSVKTSKELRKGIEIVSQQPWNLRKTAAYYQYLIDTSDTIPEDPNQGVHPFSLMMEGSAHLKLKPTENASYQPEDEDLHGRGRKLPKSGQLPRRVMQGLVSPLGIQKKSRRWSLCHPRA